MRISRRFDPSIVFATAINRLAIATVVVMSEATGLVSIQAGKTLAEAIRRALLGLVQNHVSRSAGEPADSTTYLHLLAAPPLADSQAAPFIELTPAHLMRQLTVARVCVEYEPLIPVYGLSRELICARVAVVPQHSFAKEDNS
ncbi:MAG: hypothetical protein ING75_03705 [Rhodocyclaceae bacterium]|nr:hypothetical protein [Rhodocyclaceae bacterium]